MHIMKKIKQVKRNKKSRYEDIDIDKEESQFLSKLLILEKLLLEHKIICDGKYCNLQAWLIYVRNKSSIEQNTCIDCILQDYNNWIIEEHCNEVKVLLPIDIN